MNNSSELSAKTNLGIYDDDLTLIFNEDTLLIGYVENPSLPLFSIVSGLTVKLNLKKSFSELYGRSRRQLLFRFSKTDGSGNEGFCENICKLCLLFMITLKLFIF